MSDIRDHRYFGPAVFSFITFLAAMVVIFVKDQRDDAATAFRSCELSADARAVVRSSFIRLADLVPGESQVELDFRDFLDKCQPPRDCKVSVLAPPVPDSCLVEPRTTTTTGG